MDSTTMRLSPEAITEFKRIFAEECGVVLSDDDANAQGLELLRLFDLLTRSPDDESSDRTGSQFDVPRGTGSMGYPSNKEQKS
ncbi:MAG: hypothetical protein KGS61_19555 [Verrucomicrobia bacterium]|nr:hypothetical protein [Verrucomicrobiota bacterium]